MAHGDGNPEEEQDMSKAARLQKAAYDAHQRGKKALDEGDIYGATVNDKEAADLALAAMLQRMRDRADHQE